MYRKQYQKGVETDLAGIVRVAGLQRTLVNPDKLDGACL